MKTPIPHYPSPLGRMQPTPMDIEATKRQGWRDQRILVISDQDARLDLLERQLIRNIGERLYGRGQNHGDRGSQGGDYG